MTHSNFHKMEIKAEAQAASASTSTQPGLSTDAPPHGFTKASMAVMDNFLLAGKLNPKIEPSR